jgi:hypothetical protein
VARPTTGLQAVSLSVFGDFVCLSYFVRFSLIVIITFAIVSKTGIIVDYPALDILVLALAHLSLTALCLQHCIATTLAQQLPYHRDQMFRTIGNRDNSTVCITHHLRGEEG